jgi:phage repressor protein C with HTH and peptisase S24 domain
LGACTRAQNYAKDEPGPLHSKPERRFAIYEVPSDYMAPTFQPDELVEIDTTVTRAHADGVYLIDFSHGEPALRRVQVIPGGRVRVYCDRDAGTPHVEECDERRLAILGRATRALHGRRL